jgi:cathepsin B
MAYAFKPCAHHVPASEKYDTCPTKEYSAHCKAECEDGYGSDYVQDKVGAQTAYSVRGITQIQQDLLDNGPLYVAFTVYDDFPTYKSGVYQHTSRKQLGGHAVTMVGWGTLDGQDYWRIKNSWNEEWGDNGHFLISRGHDECGIERSAGAGKVDGSVYEAKKALAMVNASISV